jgi:hypothetical protein
MLGLSRRRLGKAPTKIWDEIDRFGAEIAPGRPKNLRGYASRA